MVHWRKPGANELVSALNKAFPRFLLGFAGTGSALGPIVYMFGSPSTSWILSGVLLLTILLCYAWVYLTCVYMSWTPWKVLFSETRWAMCFIIIGELASNL